MEQFNLTLLITAIKAFQKDIIESGSRYKPIRVPIELLCNEEVEEGVSQLSANFWRNMVAIVFMCALLSPKR